MPGTEFVCGECGYRFRAPDTDSIHTRSVMCPSCGSIDLNIVTAPRGVSGVMRAKLPVAAGGQESTDSGTS